MGYITSYFGSPDTKAVEVYFFPKFLKFGSWTKIAHVLEML